MLSAAAFGKVLVPGVEAAIAYIIVIAIAICIVQTLVRTNR